MLDTSSSFSILNAVLTAIISIVVVVTVFIVMRLKYPIIIRANDKKRKVSTNDVALLTLRSIRSITAMLRFLDVLLHDIRKCIVSLDSIRRKNIQSHRRNENDSLRKLSKDSELKDRVEVVLVKGYIWKFATRNKVNVMYRGIRTWKKDGDEETHLHFQNLLGPILLGRVMPPETRFVESEPKYMHISSSKIRSAVEKGAVSIENDVPKIILKDVKSLWKSI